MKRIPLALRHLPDYTHGEEAMNTVTHIVGAAMAILALILGICKTVQKQDPLGIVSAVIYGVSMLSVYTVSSVYHGMPSGTGKKVMQVLDHCTIYFLIAGSYTPIALSALLPVYPGIAWRLLLFQWGLTAVAVTLTAIDLRKYRVFSMLCYIGMGWAVLPFLAQTRAVLTGTGFTFLLAGGIAYTLGAILYGIGSKKRWFHSVFHIFVVLGSALQMVAILKYAL